MDEIPMDIDARTATHQLLLEDEIMALRLQEQEYKAMQKFQHHGGDNQYSNEYEELGIKLRYDPVSEKPLDPDVCTDISGMNDLDTDGACGGGGETVSDSAMTSTSDAILARCLQDEFNYDQSQADMSMANHLLEEEENRQQRSPFSRVGNTLRGFASPLRTRYQRHSRGRSSESEPWVSLDHQEPQSWDFQNRGYDIGPNILPEGEMDPDVILQQYGAMSDENFVHMVRDPALLTSLLMGRAPDMMVPDNVDLNDYEALWDLAERLGEVKKCGMTEEEISHLPTHQIMTGTEQAAAQTEQSSECRVCLNDFESEDTVRTLPCLHVFHVSCIDEWLKRNAICPVCRKEVKVH